jgi:putative tryptophan/tyrosine transport system substrate-binding protein
MNRRELITVLVTAAAWPPFAASAAAQQAATVPVIGILSGGSPETFAPFEEALRKGLAEAKLVESRNFRFEYRWARGNFSQLPDLAVDLARGSPFVIVTNTLPAALAAKAATSAVPVVFVIGEDPIKAGLVASFNRPNANVTGVTNFMNVLGAKRMELASELVPTAAELALLVNQNNPNAETDTADLRAASDALDRKLLVLTASSDAEIEAAFAASAQQKIGALFVNIDPLFVNRRGLFAALASRYAVPTIYPLRDFVDAGGLMSYGANFADAWRQAGAYSARILRGAKPADLPVLQPTKIELVINLNAAKALGLNIPPKLLALADEVVE